jgi:hypothetical protein
MTLAVAVILQTSPGMSTEYYIEPLESYVNEAKIIGNESR